MCLIMNTNIMIIYNIIFNLSFKIFCDSNKIVIKMFNIILLISNLSSFNVYSMYFTSNILFT
jgi:PPE-repeat protein